MNQALRFIISQSQSVSQSVSDGPLASIGCLGKQDMQGNVGENRIIKSETKCVGWVKKNLNYLKLFEISSSFAAYSGFCLLAKYVPILG